MLKISLAEKAPLPIGSSKKPYSKKHYLKEHYFKGCYLKRQGGAGLVEILVSLLILGVGLLGVMSLQVNGISSNQRAWFVTEAHVLAQDMADRIRSFGADGRGELAGLYDGTNTLDENYADQNCTICGPAQTIAQDQHEWEQALTQVANQDGTRLPSASGSINWDSTTQTYTIRVFWDQERTGLATVPTECTGAIDAGCYEVAVKVYRP